MQNDFEKRLARIKANHVLTTPSPDLSTPAPQIDVCENATTGSRIGRYMLKKLLGIVLPVAVFIGLVGYVSTWDNDGASGSGKGLFDLSLLSDLMPALSKNAEMSYMLFKYESGWISKEEMGEWLAEYDPVEWRRQQQGY